MSTRKLTISTFLIIFLLFVPPVLGQSRQQNSSNNNNWVSQIQTAALGALVVLAVQILVGRIGNGGKFERQADISKVTNPIFEELEEIDDKLNKFETKFEEQEKTNSRMENFVKREVRGLGDRLEEKIQQTNRDLEAEKKRNEASQAKLEEAVKEATKEIHEMSLNIARMTEAFKHFQTNQK